MRTSPRAATGDAIDRLGRYELLSRLGIGGMAEVYLARAEGLAGFAKLLVVKRILPHLAHDPKLVSMFLDEARLAAQLSHPNLIQVFDIGSEGGRYYYAMELVSGQSLDRVVKRARQRGEPLDLGAIIAILDGVGEGLHHAHEMRDEAGQPLELVHRDVTPSNMLVTYDGGVKLVDFGIAKARSNLTETVTGSIKGKYQYMSPEQTQGAPLDRRSDVFALGVVLYELTTGKRPFDGDSELAIMNAVVAGRFVAPSALDRDYPPALEHIIYTALQARPEGRFATVRELVSDLEAFAREAQLSASPRAIASTMRGLFGEEIASWQTRNQQDLRESMHLAARQFAAVSPEDVLELVAGGTPTPSAASAISSADLTVPAARAPTTPASARHHVLPPLTPPQAQLDPSPLAPPRRRWPTIAVAGTLALAAGLGSFAVVRARSADRRSPTPTPTPTAATTPAPTPTAATTPTPTPTAATTPTPTPTAATTPTPTPTAATTPTPTPSHPGTSSHRTHGRKLPAKTGTPPAAGWTIDSPLPPPQ